MSIFRCYSLACTMIPCLLLQMFLVVRKKDRNGKELTVHLSLVYVFLFYIWMVLEVTGIGLLAEVLRGDTEIVASGVNFIPFDSGVRGYVLNIIMLMPFGFLTAFIWKECRDIRRILLMGFGFSLIIEITQLFNYRTTDVDDLTANTLGAVIGYLIYKVFRRLFGEWLQTERLCRNEAVFYVLAAVLGTFLLFNPYLLL